MFSLWRRNSVPRASRQTKDRAAVVIDFLDPYQQLSARLDSIKFTRLCPGPRDYEILGSETTFASNELTAFPLGRRPLAVIAIAAHFSSNGFLSLLIGLMHFINTLPLLAEIRGELIWGNVA